MTLGTTAGNRGVWLACLGVFAFGCGSSATEMKPDAAERSDAIEIRDLSKADGPAAADDASTASRDVPADDGKATVDASGVFSDTQAPDTGSPVDGGAADAPANADTLLDAAVDTGGKEVGPSVEAGARDVFWSSVVRFCAGKGPLSGFNYCRTVKDCGPTGPIACSVGPYDWGPSACPIPPSMQPCPAECTADTDCTAKAGGKCNVFTRACPRCNGHTCSYPPPPCTSSPNSCGTGQRCRADGTCEPIPCTEGNACAANYRCNAGSTKANPQGCEPIPCDAGHACPAETRCNVGSSRADIHGCESVPCSEGYACPENTRCTVTAPAAGNHGCTAMTCNSDADCDCGYCVNGVCSADPGTCQTPPA